MPIYEYRCDNCAHEFETIQKLSEAPLTTCPACSQEALRKKVSAAGFRLKGGGWYETDFKGSRKKNVAGEEKSKEGGEKSSGNGGDGGGKSEPGGKAGAETTKSGGNDTKPGSDGAKSGGASKSGSSKSESS